MDFSKYRNQDQYPWKPLKFTCSHCKTNMKKTGNSWPKYCHECGYNVSNEINEQIQLYYIELKLWNTENKRREENFKKDMFDMFNLKNNENIWRYAKSKGSDNAEDVYECLMDLYEYDIIKKNRF